MIFTTFPKELRATAPTCIDPDDLSRIEQRAYTSLTALADALKRNTFGASRTVKDNWSLIWPWLVAMCRGVLDRPIPKTVRGVEIASTIVTIAPYFFTHPSYKPDGATGDIDTALKRLLASTPRLLSLTLEMWLHASTINHPHTDHLAGVLFFLISNHDDVSKAIYNLEAGEATEAFRNVAESERWDIPSICIRSITDKIFQLPMDCNALRIPLVILGTLAHGITYKKGHVPHLLQKYGTRWATQVALKLSFPKNYYRGLGFQPVDIATCLLETISFVYYSIGEDAYHALEALDKGILTVIFRAREVIIWSCENEAQFKFNLSRYVELLLEQITTRLMHQPILVRAARGLKKLEKLQEATGVSEPFPEGASSLREKWAQLKAEVAKRVAIKNSLEPYSGQFVEPICGFFGCSRTPKELDLSHRFLRCSGCYTDVYCSEECRGKAWNDKVGTPHKDVCNWRRKKLELGHIREPGDPEKAFMLKQIAHDLASHSELIQQLQDAYPTTTTTSSPSSTSGCTDRLLTYIDYSTHPPRFEAITVSEAEKRIHPHYDGYVRRKGDLICLADETYKAVGWVPWQEGTPKTVVFREGREYCACCWGRGWGKGPVVGKKGDKKEGKEGEGKEGSGGGSGDRKEGERKGESTSEGKDVDSKPEKEKGELGTQPEEKAETESAPEEKADKEPEKKNESKSARKRRVHQGRRRPGRVHPERV
ncbi:hypothetical protein V5O48_014569 [Marasmius crinis-equi]|uniref:MYND-type domain-containing protein n=1 Tax=Marasmius crinis-equi TaxID=585013 RepID=A0ABR3EWY6_9AGAR